MKFILSLLISIILSTPVLADTDPCTNYDEDLAGCRAYTGCGYSTQYDECNSCPDDKYNDGNFDECQSCSSYPFQYNSGMIWDQTPSNNHPGQASCPWVCDNGYYKSGNSCEQCPTGSAPGIGNNSIEECCYNDTITKYLITNSSHDTYRCASINNPETKYDATNRTFYCVTGAVPSYSNGFLTACHCNSSGHAVYNPTTEICECDPTSQYPTPSTDNDGVVSCSACPANAFNDNGTCKCNVNYYGNGLTCTQCPAGTTKSAGGDEDHPTTQSACHFTSGATKFCVPSTTRTVDNSGYMCFTPNNVTYLY